MYQLFALWFLFFVYRDIISYLTSQRTDPSSLSIAH